jgi:hypothetical protein
VNISLKVLQNREGQALSEMASKAYTPTYRKTLVQFLPRFFAAKAAPTKENYAYISHYLS